MYRYLAVPLLLLWVVTALAAPGSGLGDGGQKGWVQGEPNGERWQTHLGVPAPLQSISLGQHTAGSAHGPDHARITGGPSHYVEFPESRHSVALPAAPGRSPSLIPVTDRYPRPPPMHPLSN